LQKSIFGLFLFRLLFLLFPNKASQISDFRVSVLVEIIPMTLSISDLQKVIIQSFLNDPDLPGGIVQFVMYDFRSFTWKSCVQFAPQSHLLDYFSDCFFLLLGTLFIVLDLNVALSELLLLLLDKYFNLGSYSFSQFQFAIKLPITILKGVERNSLGVSRVLSLEFAIGDVFGNEESKNEVLVFEMKVTYGGIVNVIKVFSFQFENDLVQHDLIVLVDLNSLGYGQRIHRVLAVLAF
jgi:hypothetical protein